jgi:hypothetical protein
MPDDAASTPQAVILETVRRGLMAEYRLYIFDLRGRMSREALIHCETDQDAIRAAEKRRGDQRMELWRGGRLVREFAAGGG